MTRLLLLLSLLVLLLGPPGGIAVATDRGNNEGSLEEVTTLVRMAAEMSTLVKRLQDDNAELSDFLDQSALAPEQIVVDLPDLERAYLASLAARSQRDLVSSRFQVRQDSRRQLAEILQLEAGVSQVYSNFASAPAIDPDLSQRIVYLDRQRAILTATNGLLEQMSVLVRVTEQHYQLAQDRLMVLQAALELTAFTEGNTTLAGLRSLHRRADHLLQRSLQLRNEMAALEDDPDQQSQRQLLMLQAMDAEERSNLLQIEIYLRRIRHSLDTFSALLDTDAIPVRVLWQAQLGVNELIDNLTIRAQDLELVLALVDSQRRLSNQPNLDQQTRQLSQELLRDLDDITSDHQTDITNLVAVIENLQQRLEGHLKRRVSEILHRRRTLPNSTDGWQRLTLGLHHLPSRLLAHLFRSGAAIGDRWQQLNWPARGVLGAMMAVIILISLTLRRWRPPLLGNQSSPLLANLFHAISVSFPYGLALLLGITATLSLELLFRHGYPFLVILTSITGLRFLLALGRHALLSSAPTNERHQYRYRRLRAILLTAGGVILVLLLIQHVPLYPGSADIIDRLLLLALLVLVTPGCWSHRWVRAIYHRQGRQPGPRIMLVAWTGSLLGLASVALLVLGIAGYVGLTWFVAVHLGLLALVTGLALITLELFRGLLGRLSHYLQGRYPGQAPLWQDNLLVPGYQVVVVLVVLGSAALLWRLFGWTSQTPGIRLLWEWATLPLITWGESGLNAMDVASSVLLVALVFWLGNWIRRICYHLVFRRIQDLGIRQSLAVFFHYLAILVGLLFTLQVLGIDLTALAVFAGALGVGIGFGSQAIVNNFISGLLLLAERPLRVTDIIRVGEYEGEVTRIGIRSLTVQTWDNQEVIIPNSAVISDAFTNWTRSDDLNRVLLMIPIGRHADPEQAIALIREVLDHYPPVVAHPGIKVLLWELTASAQLFRVQYHIHYFGSTGLLNARSEVLRRISKRFQEAGIPMPHNQHDVRLHGHLPLNEPQAATTDTPPPAPVRPLLPDHSGD